MQNQCPECGASVPAGESCQSKFYAVLYRENDIGLELPDFFSSPAGQTAHFFAVSCYAIQHPRSMGYTVEALLGARENVELHLLGRLSIPEIRRKVRQAVFGSGRVLRREGEPIHDWGVAHWPVTVDSVLASSPQDYLAATTRWAQATLEAIKAASPPQR